MDLRYSCYKVPGLSSPILDSQHTAFLDDRYRLREQLGWGQFGLIRACSDLHTGEALACKSISKARLVSADDVRSVKLEIEIMARLSGHPNVVDLKAVYEEQDYVHLVMELCSGGELFHRLEKRGRFLERDAAVLFRHLMEVLIYCHDHGVVHRDLKPENILLATKSSSSPIKLADFGLATYIEPGQRLCGTVGSPLYIAPEVLAGSYNQAADVWSAGVILYVLLSGVPPFWGKTKSKIFDAVRSLELRFPSDPWDGVSESAKLLVAGMLCRDSAQRLTAKQVIEHSWIQEFAHQVVHEADNCHQTALRFAQEESESCSSLSSLLINCRASSSPYVINPTAGFSFPSAMELSAPIPLLPGFSFFGASSSGDQKSILNLISNDAKGDLIHREPSFCELFTCGDEEGGGGGGGGRRGVAAVGLRSKRNRTIGFGEHEQLDLTASEYVIRWASCAHLHGAASLGSSLVC